jgi:uncharacterized protein (TIGR03000 family)
MFRRFSLLLPATTLVTATLFPSWSVAQVVPGFVEPKAGAGSTTTSSTAAQTSLGYGNSQGYGGSQGGVGSQGGSGSQTGGSQGVGAETVVCPGGCYGGGRIRNYCRGVYSGAGYYGFFRRYYGYPFYGPSYPVASQHYDFGCCSASGIVYRSGYGFHGAGGCGPGSALPLPDGSGGITSLQGTNAAGVPANAPVVPPTKEAPPSDNTAHLQLLVPEKAEVLIDDGKTTQTGTVREFVSPQLLPGKSFLYKLSIHYTDANGATIDEQHSIRVHANDRLRLDFTAPHQQQEVGARSVSEE